MKMSLWVSFNMSLSLRIFVNPGPEVLSSLRHDVHDDTDRPLI